MFAVTVIVMRSPTLYDAASNVTPTDVGRTGATVFTYETAVAAPVVAGSVTVIVAVPAFTPVTVTTPEEIATVATDVSEDLTVNPDGIETVCAAASVAVIV